MNLHTRALLYQLACFAVLFIALRFLIDYFTTLQGIWVGMIAFVVGTILSPKFKAIRTPQGDKLFVRWMFINGVKEIK